MTTAKIIEAISNGSHDMTWSRFGWQRRKGGQTKMKEAINMKATTLSLATIVILFFSGFTQADTLENKHEARKQASRTIDAQAKKESNKDGACEVGEIKQESYDDLHEIFVYEMAGCIGGNHSEQYIFVTTLKGNKWIPSKPLQIGGRSDFQADRIKVDEKTIYISGKAWKDDDSACCPTTTKVKKFTVVNDNIKPIKK